MKIGQKKNWVKLRKSHWKLDWGFVVELKHDGHWYYYGLRTNKLHDIFLFFWDLYLGLRGAEKDFPNLSSLKSLMSCRKQHFIFITKVETGVSVQNQNMYICCVLSSCWQNVTILGCFASIDRDKNASLSLVSITFCGSCGAGLGWGCPMTN